MTRWLIPIAFAALAATLAACNPQSSSGSLPAPHEISDDSVAEFCGMGLGEHAGPKGQIFVRGLPDHPYWFASVRDAIAFTMLPEMPKDITAVYVNDMGKAMNWAHPEPGTWIEAHQALFVIASRRTGGMGEPEAVPFGSREAAQRFMAANGGRLVRFADIPKDYILGSDRPPVPPRDPAETVDAGQGGAVPPAEKSGTNR